MMTAIPKPQRVLDPAYQSYIRGMPCLLYDRDPCECGGFLDVILKRPATEAAHVTSRGAGGGDDSLVPLCGAHHRTQPDSVHRGGIKSFEKKYGVNLKRIAKELRRAFLWADRA